MKSASLFNHSGTLAALLTSVALHAAESDVAPTGSDTDPVTLAQPVAAVQPNQPAGAPPARVPVPTVPCDPLPFTSESPTNPCRRCPEPAK